MATGNWKHTVYKRGPQINLHDWTVTRMNIIRRDRYTCQRCERRFANDISLTVHHIIPREDGGTNEPNNLITLCDNCHDFVELHSREFFTAALIRGSYGKPDVIKTTATDNDWHTWVYGGMKRPEGKAA